MIECYFHWCRHHSIHDGEDIGPFCCEYNCVATDQEIESFRQLRKEELKESGADQCKDLPDTSTYL